jgi:hypothetical protein
MLAQPRIFRQDACVRRQELRLVASYGRYHPARDEVGRVVEQPDELVDHLGDIDRHGTPGALAVSEQEHRRRRIPLAQLVQQRNRLRMRAFAVQAEIPVEQHGA